MTSNPELFWGLIASMWIGNAMLIILTDRKFNRLRPSIAPQTVLKKRVSLR